MEPVQIEVHPDNLKELVVGDKKFRSAMDFRLSDYDLAICQNDLNETDVVRKDCLQKLRELLQNDEDITYRMDEAYLLRYLRFKKFDCEEAYKIIRKFYRTRRENPILLPLQSSLHETFYKVKICKLLPYLTEEGNIVVSFQLGNWNLEELTMNDALLGFSFVSDVFSMNPHCQVNGVVSLWDFNNVTIGQMVYMTHPKNARLWAKLLQELYPAKVDRVLILNCGALLYTMFVGIRCFLKKEIADRMIILRSDMKELHKQINPAILPEEYGGSVEDSEWNTYLHRCMADNEKYIEYEYSFIDVKKPH